MERAAFYVSKVLATLTTKTVISVWELYSNVTDFFSSLLL